MTAEPTQTGLRVLAEQLRRPGPLPAALHRAAWAGTAQDTSEQAQTVRVLLAGRSDAPDDLVRRYRQHPYALVRGAYLCRADHDEQHLRAELAGEYRTDLLATLARHDQDRPHLRMIVEEKFRCRPSLGVAVALMHSVDRREHRTQQALLEFLLPRRGRIGAQLEQRLPRLIEYLCDEPGDPGEPKPVDLVAELLTEHPDLSCPLFSRTGLSVAARTALLRALDPSAGDTPVAVGDLLDLPDVQPDVLEVITTLIAQLPDGSADHLAARAAAYLHRNQPAQQLSTADMLDRARGGDSHAACTILTCYSIPLDDRVAVVATAARPLTMLVEHLRHHPVEEEIIDAAALTDPPGFAAAGGWRLYPDIAHAQSRLVVDAALGPVRGQAINGLLRSGLCAPALLLVPWLMFATAAANAAGDSRWDDTLSILAEQQTRLLGDDPGVWETFTLLADDFPGTVGDLLHTSAAVHQTGT